MALGIGLIGAGLGAAAGATSPTPGVFDYKKEGIGFLTGNHAERKEAFAPTLQKLLDQSQGKGLTMSSAERSQAAMGEIARLKAAETGIRKGVQQRSIGRGHGAGSGMTEAANLQVGISGLNAQRGVMGQIAAADMSGRNDRQMRAAGMATDLFSKETGQENAAIGAQWQSEEDQRMAGSRAHRAIGGAAQGWGSSGQAMGAYSKEGNPWWGTLGQG